MKDPYILIFIGYFDAGNLKKSPWWVPMSVLFNNNKKKTWLEFPAKTGFESKSVYSKSPSRRSHKAIEIDL